MTGPNEIQTLQALFTRYDGPVPPKAPCLRAEAGARLFDRLALGMVQAAAALRTHAPDAARLAAMGADLMYYRKEGLRFWDQAERSSPASARSINAPVSPTP